MNRQKEIIDVIDILYGYYLAQKAEIKEDRFSELGFDENGNHKCLENRIYYLLQDYFGKTQFPVRLSDEEYKNTYGVEVFHGFEDIEHGYHYLNTHNRRHYGVGIQGNGFYVSTSEMEARCYAVDKLGKIYEDRVVKFKIIPCNIVERDDMEKAKVYLDHGNKENFKFMNLSDEDKLGLECIYEKIEQLGDKKFKNHFLSNISNIAFLLGYDAIRAKRLNRDDDHLIVLEPSVLLISESEAKRVEELAGCNEKN